MNKDIEKLVYSICEKNDLTIEETSVVFKDVESVLITQIRNMKISELAKRGE